MPASPHTLRLPEPQPLNSDLGESVLDGAVLSVMARTVRDGKIVEIDIISDPARLARLGVKP